MLEEKQSRPLSAIEFKPLDDGPVQREIGISPVYLGLGVVLTLAALSFAFLLAARAVIFHIDPGDASVTVSGLSFRIGDNEVTLGAGANRTDDDWFGGIDFRIANPSAGAGPISYFPELPTSSSGIVVDGQSFSYSGPMLKQPPNDGSNPPPVDAGEGTISITCP